MLTQPQIWKLKAAQKQAGIDDEEYRAALQQLCGVATSKDASLGNDQWDMLMSYFEAIYWRGVEAGTLQRPCKDNAPFQKPGYWASKNRRTETSRDRYNLTEIHRAVAGLENELGSLGCAPSYLDAIRFKVTRGQETVAALYRYLGALRRTHAFRLKKARVECPF